MAALANTVVKCGMILALASRTLRLKAILATAARLGAGLAAVLLR